MYQFQLTLKNEKFRFYNRLSWLIIGINSLFFLYLAVIARSAPERGKYIAILVLLPVCFLLKQYFRRTRYAFGFYPFFILLILGWVSAGNYWLAGINLVFLVLSMEAAKQLTLSFSNEGIAYPSFFSRKMEWPEINNCLLKDGLLTIDLKNNKLIQQELEGKQGIKRITVQEPIPERHDSNEQEFNDFCKERLTIDH